MNLVKTSFLHALGTVVYVTIVVLIMQNANQLFGFTDSKLLGPMAFLMLFVLSAAIVGSLVLARPAMLYLNGQKSEGVRLFVYILGWLLLAILIVFGWSALNR